MLISFNLPHVFNGTAPAEENAWSLQALLDCLVTLNRAYLRTHAVPPLYRSGVRYGRTSFWEPIPALYKRGYGDCKSLSAALIAEYQMAGIEAKPVFRWVKRSDGTSGTDYHILVQTAKGWEDPSKVLGMGQNEWKWFR